MVKSMPLIFFVVASHQNLGEKKSRKIYIFIAPSNTTNMIHHLSGGIQAQRVLYVYEEYSLELKVNTYTSSVRKYNFEFEKFYLL